MVLTTEAIAALPSTLLPDGADRGKARGHLGDIVEDTESQKAYILATGHFKDWDRRETLHAASSQG